MTLTQCEKTKTLPVINPPPGSSGGSRHMSEQRIAHSSARSTLCPSLLQIHFLPERSGSEHSWIPLGARTCPWPQGMDPWWWQFKINVNFKVILWFFVLLLFKLDEKCWSTWWRCCTCSTLVCVFQLGCARPAAPESSGPLGVAVEWGGPVLWQPDQKPCQRKDLQPSSEDLEQWYARSKLERPKVSKSCCFYVSIFLKHLLVII